MVAAGSVGPVGDVVSRRTLRIAATAGFGATVQLRPTWPTPGVRTRPSIDGGGGGGVVTGASVKASCAGALTLPAASRATTSNVYDPAASGDGTVAWVWPLVVAATTGAPVASR